MSVLENFILAHPQLMRPEIIRIPVIIGTFIFVLAALWLAFSKGKIDEELSWSLLEGKCFRLCWCVAASAVIVMAYGQWHFPETRDFVYPKLEWTLWLLWFALFWAAVFFSIRKMRRAKRDEQSDS